MRFILAGAMSAALLGFLGTGVSAQRSAVAPGGYNPKSTEAVRQLLEKRLGEQRIVPGQIVVKLKPGALGPAGAAPNWASALSAGETPRITSGGELVIRVGGAGFSGMSAGDKVKETKRVIEQLRGRSDIEYVQPNYLLQIVALPPNDTLYPRQWHYLPRSQAPGGVGLPAAWSRSTGSSSVIVAVIDTGILPSHPDVTGSAALLTGFDMVSDLSVANDGNARDPDPTDPGDAVHTGECGVDFLGQPVPDREVPSSWHGSHVAGTIGVERTDNALGVAGINWNARVLPIRVLGKCGGSIVDINDGIRWAAGLDVPGLPHNTNPAKVINMSLGGRGDCSQSPATQKAIDDAFTAGVTIVVAAGNEAEDAAGFMPASCKNVITVAASDFNGKLATRYSNFGDRVDIMAPGGDVAQDANHDGFPDGVLSLVAGGYDYYNGTSMAAPHVAGVAALLLAQSPGLSPTVIRDQLRAHAIPRSTAQCPHPCGAGLLNADFVPTSGTPTPPPSPPTTPPHTPTVPALSGSGWLVMGLLFLGWRLRRRRGAEPR